jgi:Squalene-hopene cyclase C-terminal domain
MPIWKSFLRDDPLPRLLEADDPALTWHVRHDLLDERREARRRLWELPEPRQLLARQRSSGAWEYPKKGSARQPYNNFAVLETWRSLGVLVAMYAFDRSHPAIERAAAYLFTCQTREGDLRGILGNQYMPYYHSTIMELLVRAGFAHDEHVRRGLDWLLTVRQDDGGWIVPTQAVPASRRTHRYWRGAPLPPNRSLPFSHMATGMALRGLVAHPAYRRRREVRAACEILKARMFQPDRYGDRQGREYWLKFQYPFWWPNILTVLDMLHRVGFTAEDEHVQLALQWFATHQRRDGVWDTGYGHGRRAARTENWVALAVCRVLRAFLD